MKIPSLKNLQHKTNKKLDELAGDFVKIYTKDISLKEFEQTKEKIYKIAKKVQPDVQFLELIDKAKRS